MPETALATRCRIARACASDKVPPVVVRVTEAVAFPSGWKARVGALARWTRAALTCGIARRVRASSPSFARQ